MRNELYADKIGKPVRNNVFVEVIDIFNEIQTNLGFILPNMSDEESKGDSPGYSFREFAVRFGKVVGVPDIITPGSFDYDTEVEVKEGDIVYWNYFSFLNHQPIVVGEKKYLLVDYHDIIFRIRDEKITPVNGNALFAPVPEKISFAEFESVKDVTEKWIIHTLPERLPSFRNQRHYTDVNWEIGDKVFLAVGDKPFEIEGDIVKNLPGRLFACPVRMILCTVD